MEENTVLIIEDNRLLRDSIRAEIEHKSDLKVEAALSNGENILRLVLDQKPDVLLLSVDVQTQNIFETVLSVKISLPETKIIIMGIVPSNEAVVAFIEVGVSGFILKDATIEEFMETIRSVQSDEKVLPGNLTKSLFSFIAGHGSDKYGVSKMIKSAHLTRRELDVVSLIAAGLSNKEIADKLNLSTYTVKTHVHNLFVKMAMTTRVQIAMYARTSEVSNLINSSGVYAGVM